MKTYLEYILIFCTKKHIENSLNLGKTIQEENNSKQVSTQSLSFSYQFF